MSERELHGTFTAYQPMYFDDDRQKWRHISTRHSPTTQAAGVKFPLCFGGLMQEIFLYGEAQANALAWGYAAECDALNGVAPDVKITPFKVKFDLVVEAIPEDAQAKEIYE